MLQTGSHPLKAVPIAVADEESESEEDELKPRGKTSSVLPAGATVVGSCIPAMMSRAEQLADELTGLAISAHVQKVVSLNSISGRVGLLYKALNPSCFRSGG